MSDAQGAGRETGTAREAILARQRQASVAGLEERAAGDLEAADAANGVGDGVRREGDARGIDIGDDVNGANLSVIIKEHRVGGAEVGGAVVGVELPVGIVVPPVATADLG